MVRLKFIVFAFVAMSAGVAHMWLLSPVLAEKATQRALDGARPLIYVAQGLIEQRKALVIRAVMLAKGAEANGMLMRDKSRPSELSPASLEALENVLAPLDMGEVIVGLALGDRTLLKKGETSVKLEDLSLEWKTLKDAGLDGLTLSVQPLSAKPFFMVSVPTDLPAQAGLASEPLHAIVGVPVIDTQALSKEALALGLRAAAYASAGKLIPMEERSTYIEALRRGAALADGVLEPFEVGSTWSLGPLNLPMMTLRNAAGGNAPLEGVLKLPVPGSRVDVVAVMSLRQDMEALAAYQQLVLLGLAGLLMMALIWTVWIGVSPDAEARMAITGPIQVRSPTPKATRAITSESLAALSRKTDEAVAQQASVADDFEFQDKDSQQALSSLAQTSVRRADSEETHAYDPSFSPAGFSLGKTDWNRDAGNADAEALSAFSPAPTNAMAQNTVTYLPDPFGEGEATNYSPEQTKVATVPQELIHASVHGTEPSFTKDRKPLAPLAPVPTMAVSASTGVSAESEDAYFQTVYREFLMVRQQCGEDTESVPFEKFAQKLRKYREQLMQKPGVKSVRFQVYVKDGKAQVKASSVRQS